MQRNGHDKERRRAVRRLRKHVCRLDDAFRAVGHSLGELERFDSEGATRFAPSIGVMVDLVRNVKLTAMLIGGDGCQSRG
jgi:hypothetical protein